jgi:hypothetical protein
VVAAMEEVEKRLTEKFQQAWEASTATLMELSKKMDGLDTLSTKMSEMEKRQMEHEKITKYVQAKMDLSMKSLAQVSQDQARLSNVVANANRGGSVAQRGGTGDGLMGAHPQAIPPSFQTSQTAPHVSHPTGGSGNHSSGEEARFGQEEVNRRGIESDQHHRRTWLPKWDFLVFEGEEARVWIDNCEAYFLLYQIPEEFRVSAASLHLKGRAAHWYQSFRDSVGFVDWIQFKLEIRNEFDLTTHSDRMLELLTLRQTGTVLEYKTQFEKLVYCIRLFDKAVSETFLVTQFVLGLKHELKVGVEMQFPKTVAMAAQLALKHESLHSRHTAGTRKAVGVKGVPPVGFKEGTESQGELWKAKQLKDYRRANGLCFKCGEKYMPGHKCKVPVQPLLNCISLEEGGDGGPLLSDELLDYLETNGDKSYDGMTVSLNAMSGTNNPRCVRIQALIKDQLILQLLDSGSSNTFISELACSRIGCETQNIEPVAVKVANEQIIYCQKKVVQLKWWCGGKTFTVDAFVLPATAYDMVLGMDWLEKFSPMLCDCDRKWVEFSYEGVRIRLQGVGNKSAALLPEASHEQIQRWHKGNEIWAVALLQQVTPELKVVTGQVPECVQEVLDQFKEVFKTPDSLPPSREYDHTISLLPGTTPVNVRPYRYSPLQKDEIERQVQEMLQAGTITRSVSPFASPVLLVKKKDGSWRFCVDYRKLNDITVKNKFPMPIIDEFIDELAGAKVFSKLDMAAGFHQIRMADQDEMKIAFKTHHGHFQFRVMPFGLTNAPATFQCLMNAVFQQLMRKCVLIFMDDILVYSPSLETHVVHLQQVFQVLETHQLYAKRSKCAFALTQIEYLGHIISDKGVSTDPSKTESMRRWPTPKSHTELRGFLGLTGYYRKFVKGYGILAKPLTVLLQQKQFGWPPSAQTAFEALKDAMITTPVLALPNFSETFVIETDACDTGIGAVLSQKGHPVAFYSKALGVKNSQLSTYEKEFLAILMAVEKWRCYLSRGPFVIRTDHRSLCHL